ncbi:phosphoadenosine phosphosulfate reductase family protein [Endozoicomonas sp. ALC066]|uniref:phosphoadenosine phosphosulfate reductase domain-containing protein n=1 Tax=Endozoicomonas sp. ALC066 TaxID=3403078 RepID=UPI003BB7D369
MSQQHNLFEPITIIEHNEDKSFEDKIRDIESSLFNVWDDGWNLSISWSGGKDSSVLAAIVFGAALKYRAQGATIPPMALCHANTLLENPVIDHYSKREIKKIEKFVNENNIPVTMSVATPSLSNNYLVNLIGGRTIACLSDNDAKCSQMLKVTPITRQKRRIFKELGGKKVCTLVGKRRDESAARAANMKERGENYHTPVQNKPGEWVLSPISEFSLDDVFEYIGNVTSGMINTYSDFSDLIQVYRDGEGGECAISAYADGKARKTGCGARFGCWICLRVQNDKSMNNMLEDPKYSYMKPLSQFRQYIKARHYDWDSRNWLSRTVNDDGTIKIAPNAYSPEFCDKLMRFALSIDADERQRAYEAGEKPKFELLRLEDVIGIDVLWNRYGYQKGLHGARLWYEVNLLNRRWYPATDEPEHLPKPLPKDIKVPFADSHYGNPIHGFRDLSLAMIDQERVVVKNNRYYTDCNIADEFKVDPEGAEMFFQWEMEDAIERFHDFQICPTTAYHYLVRLGVVEIARGQHSEQERMLQLANQIWRLDLRDHLNNPQEIIARLSKHAGPSEKEGERKLGVKRIEPLLVSGVYSEGLFSGK